MARSPRTINAPSPTTSTPVQPSTPVAIPGASPAAHTPTTRTSARVRQPSALATSSLPPPITPAPAHHASSTIGTPADASSSKLPKTHVESKAHALRSVLGEKERTPCPYPSQYGGKEKCGVADDDERDEVLMAICAACAVMDNRALSADEIASSAIDQGWLRPPSAAVIPATIINNAIRAHQKRCSTSNPVRNMLLAKYQLTGSVNESVLESALHPTATEGGLRPKGTVWYLQPAGKSKWKNPFAGIEIPKVVPKKAAPARKMHREIKAKPSPANSAASADDRKGATTKARTKSMSTTMAKSASPAPTPTAAPVKIRLRLNGPSAVDVEESGEVNDSVGSSASGSRQSSVTPSISQPPLPTVKPVTRPARRSKNVLDDSSDESDTSDSDMDMDMDTGSSRLNKIPIRQRKDRPPPLPLNGSNHSRQHIPRPMGSPFIDWETGALSPSPTASASMTVPPHSSPFPSHSLDNTFWAVRHDIDRFAALETSSSSSDDDMRENGDWSMASSVLIRGADEVEDIKPVWSAQDEEAKVKEATDALRVLFPMSTPEEEEDYEPHRQLNRLDNRPTPSDSSSVNESIASSTTTKGQLKSADLAASIALAQWAGNSSPVPSPNLRFQHAQLIPDTSPTQHLSRLHNSFEASEMEIDDSGEPWLDESGELPVKAEDSFSDIDLGSTIGDIANTPEHDRQLNTAAWAMEAAASVVKQELPDEGDYPSPMPTELTVDDHTGSLLLGDGSRPGEHFRASRASSSDESHTPSSRSSELPPFEVDNSMSVVFRPNVEEVLVGPESVSVEELEDCWLPGMLPTEKTPQRGRLSKSRFQRGGNDARRCSGSWGGIGVGITPTPGSAIPFETILPTSQQMTPSRSKSSRISAKKRNHSPRTPIRPPTRSGAASLPTPPTDLDQGCADVENTEIREVDVDMDFEMDAIGTADLEAARAEAEAREEQHRKACREKAARRKELLEAYKLKVREGGETGTPNTAVTSPEAWEGVSPWSEMNTPHGGQSSAWGYSSTESINISTPGVLSPMALHSLSTLSLSGDATGYMCPKALISPPLRPSQQNASFGNTNAAHNFGGLVNGHAIMLDEVMSQAEVEAVMASVNSAPSSVKTVTPATVNTPVPIAPAKPPVPPGKPPGVTPAKNPKSDSNAATTRGPAKGPTLAPATAATPASRPNNVKASQTPSAAVPIASRKSTLQPPSKDQKPQSKPVSNTSSGSSSSLSSAPQSVSGANQPANAPKAPPAQQNGSANGPAPPQAKPYTAITKALCPGVDACVVDHIPVYAHHWENKAGTKYTLLRRLDTDFVNATSLLNALGVPPTKHADYLQAPSPRLASHHTVPSVMNGVPYSPGVAGVWVQLVEAREYARMLNLSDKTLLWNILREDLFELFAALANIKTPHAASGSFGLSFDVRAPPPRLSAATAPSTPSNDSASNSTSSLSASSGNSKSTPNLTLLSSSAPSGPGPVANGRMSALSKISPNTATHPVNGAAVNKGPLVRPAPATPPDGCPHPKRRRATIVGDMSPLAKLTNSTTPVTHTTPTGQPSATNDSNNAGAVQMKKPPARSTRASVGGAA